MYQHAIALPSFYSNSIPNHPNYHLQAWGGSTCDTLGLPNVIETGATKISNTINVFHNPFSNKFYLQVNNDVVEEPKLFDTFGKEINIAKVSIRNEYLEYSCSSLPSGVYFLVVKTFSSSQTLKLIKL